jgi:hypothetical protein
MAFPNQLVFRPAFTAALQVHQQQGGCRNPDNGLHYVHVNLSLSNLP